MDFQEENEHEHEHKRKYSNAFELRKFELEEEDKCCFHCKLVDCADTSPRCARRIFLRNRKKAKKALEKH